MATFNKKTVTVGSYRFKHPAWGEASVPVDVVEGKNGLEVVFAKGHSGITFKNITDTAIFESIEVK